MSEMHMGEVPSKGHLDRFEVLVRYREISPYSDHPRDRNEEKSQNRILVFRVETAARRPFFEVPNVSSRSVKEGILSRRLHDGDL